MRDLISAKRRGHHQVLARKLELHLCHQLDVLHVLARDLGDRDVEDVEVLPTDQVQQEIERPFERFEEHLERVRRNVEVARQLGDRLALDDRERHLALRRRRPARLTTGGGAAGTKRNFGLAGLAASSVN